MAKNVYFDRDGNKQEEIRKARGNPNRNNHTKKKNANYGGYDAAPKAKATPEKKPRLVLTKTQKTTFTVVLAVLGVLLVLQLFVFPDNTLLPIITTLLLGLTCGMMYLFRQTAPLEHTTSYKIIQLLLAFVAVAYTVFGAAGILSFIKTLG